MAAREVVGKVRRPLSEGTNEGEEKSPKLLFPRLRYQVETASLIKYVQEL